MFNRRNILASIIPVMLAAASGNVQAQKVNAEMRREMAEKGIDVDDLFVGGRKGRPAHRRCNAAEVKRASRKRRNIAKHKRSAHKCGGNAYNKAGRANR